MTKKKVRAKAKAKKRVKSKVKKAKARKPAAKGRVKKAAAKKSVSKARKSTPEMNLEKIGEVTHYFPHVNAAAVMILKDSLRVGDEIYLKGHTTDFKEKVNSIQLDRAPIQEGKKGQEIGLLVKSRVRIGDSVYKL